MVIYLSLLRPGSQPGPPGTPHVALTAVGPVDRVV